MLNEKYLGGKLQEDVAEIITGGGCQVERWSEALERADEIIDIVRSRSSGEWISTKDLMPEINEYVLLKADRYWNVPDGVPDMQVTATGYLTDFGGKYWFVFGERGMKLDAFTHWVPIPRENS